MITKQAHRDAILMNGLVFQSEIYRLRILKLASTERVESNIKIMDFIIEIIEIPRY